MHVHDIIYYSHRMQFQYEDIHQMIESKLELSSKPSRVQKQEGVELSAWSIMDKSNLRAFDQCIIHPYP